MLPVLGNRFVGPMLRQMQYLVHTAPWSSFGYFLGDTTLDQQGLPYLKYLATFTLPQVERIEKCCELAQELSSADLGADPWAALALYCCKVDVGDDHSAKVLYQLISQSDPEACSLADQHILGLPTGRKSVILGESRIKQAAGEKIDGILRLLDKVRKDAQGNTGTGASIQIAVLIAHVSALSSHLEYEVKWHAHLDLVKYVLLQKPALLASLPFECTVFLANLYASCREWFSPEEVSYLDKTFRDFEINLDETF